MVWVLPLQHLLLLQLWMRRSVQLPLGVASASGHQPDESNQSCVSSSPPVKIGESAVHQEPKSKCLWAKQQAHFAPGLSFWLSRVCSSFLGARRLQVARRRWVLKALSSALFGCSSTGSNLEKLMEKWWVDPNAYHLAWAGLVFHLANRSISWSLPAALWLNYDNYWLTVTTMHACFVFWPTTRQAKGAYILHPAGFITCTNVSGAHRNFGVTNRILRTHGRPIRLSARTSSSFVSTWPCQFAWHYLT
jgi:hypothetical protein